MTKQAWNQSPHTLTHNHTSVTSTTERGQPRKPAPEAGPTWDLHETACGGRRSDFLEGHREKTSSCRNSSHHLLAQRKPPPPFWDARLSNNGKICGNQKWMEKSFKKPQAPLALAEKQVDTKLFLALRQTDCCFLVPRAPKKGTRAQAGLMALCLDTSPSFLFKGKEPCSSSMLSRRAWDCLCGPVLW